MSKLKFARLEQQAEQLLRDSGAYRVPVPIDTVASHLNLRTTSVGLTDDLSGALVVEKGHGIIGFNASHHPVRQRFTIAHEIGHYVLHVKNAQPRLFVDKYVVYRRDDESSKGNDREEVEANAFAAALLMPESLVRQQILGHGLDLDDEEGVNALAKLFNVSPPAMSYRLVNLRLVR